MPRAAACISSARCWSLGSARRGAWARRRRWLVAAPIAGYGFAWIGHFFFEHNRPATFCHPLYSLAGDWVMFRDMLTGRIRL